MHTLTGRQVVDPVICRSLAAEIPLDELINVQSIQVWPVDFVIDLWNTDGVVVPVQVPAAVAHESITHAWTKSFLGEGMADKSTNAEYSS